MLELDSDLRPNLKTTNTNSRPDGDDKIFRPRAKSICHGLYRFGDDTQYNTSPSGMNRGDGAVAGVGHQNRQTVRGADRERDPRPVGDESVAFRQTSGVLRGYDYIRVNLTNRGKVRGIRPPGTDPGAKAMLQPGLLVKLRGVENVAVVERKHSSA